MTSENHLREVCAERLLKNLGIECVEDIDLPAIAFTLGVEVKTGNLKNCDARIVGLNNKAIITVKKGISIPRSRFSIAHELGHWQLHRGKKLACGNIGLSDYRKDLSGKERAADNFAAQILMPNYLLEPYVRDINFMNIQSIVKIAETFNVSVPAAAIKVTELSRIPMMIVYKSIWKKFWVKKNEFVPDRWRPNFHPDRYSTATQVKKTNLKMNSQPKKVLASTWFDSWYARNYFVKEQSIRCGYKDVLTLLTFPDREMLEWH